MMNSKINTPEGRLLDIIELKRPLEWRKHQPKIGKTWLNDQFTDKDFSKMPPFISFRLAKDDHEFISKLKELIDSYSGAIKWALTSHDRSPQPGVNWTISPSIFIEVQKTLLGTGISLEAYYSEKDPDFGPVAYEDLNRLTAYIEQNLS